MNPSELKNIVTNFQVRGEVQLIEAFGDGHINDTFLVKAYNGEEKKYILQKINTYVFKNVEGLMSNIDIVTKHIGQKLAAQNIEDINRHSLSLISTKIGGTYHLDDDGQYWRVFNFIEDHVVFDGTTTPEIAYEGARMFGQFIHHLADLDPSNIIETIPDFHSLRYRLSNLETMIKDDPANRVGLAKEEIKYVRSKTELMGTIQALGDKGLITPRIVHNDTKINNVLFDQNYKGLCVVDLDTIMPGYVHYDFGDGVRTSANTGAEDDEKLENVNYDLGIFEAFSHGFLDSLHNILNKEERESLVHAALLFPFIMGVRFLTDYIAGDVYYKTGYLDHNIVRAKAQLKLARDGEAKLSEMQKILNRS